MSLEEKSSLINPENPDKFGSPRSSRRKFLQGLTAVLLSSYLDRKLGMPALAQDKKEKKSPSPPSSLPRSSDYKFDQKKSDNSKLEKIKTL